jgi:hypothetical protein
MAAFAASTPDLGATVRRSMSGRGFGPEGIARLSRFEGTATESGPKVRTSTNIGRNAQLVCLARTRWRSSYKSGGPITTVTNLGSPFDGSKYGI